MEEDNVIYVYADGACRNNQSKDNIGGYGIVLSYNGYTQLHKKAFKNTTNNKMEILAVIDALKYLKKFDIPVKIFSDSQYVVNTMNCGWKRNVNLDLWAELDSLVSKFKSVSFNKVAGHSGDKYNELADFLANEAMDEFKE